MLAYSGLKLGYLARAWFLLVEMFYFCTLSYIPTLYKLEDPKWIGQERILCEQSFSQCCMIPI